MTGVRRLAVAVAVAASWGTGAAGDVEDADRALYVRYCAACHGEDGTGGGFAAPALAKPPPDLTRLARDAGGEFPVARVMRAIDGRDAVRAHGRPDMPVWGETFAREPFADSIDVRVKVHRLADHLRRIQRPNE